jgi:hypothetical protein
MQSREQKKPLKMTAEENKAAGLDAHLADLNLLFSSFIIGSQLQEDVFLHAEKISSCLKSLSSLKADIDFEYFSKMLQNIFKIMHSQIILRQKQQWNEKDILISLEVHTKLLQHLMEYFIRHYSVAAMKILVDKLLGNYGNRLSSPLCLKFEPDSNLNDFVQRHWLLHHICDEVFTGIIGKLKANDKSEKILANCSYFCTKLFLVRATHLLIKKYMEANWYPYTLRVLYRYIAMVCCEARYIAQVKGLENVPYELFKDNFDYIKNCFHSFLKSALESQPVHQGKIEALFKWYKQVNKAFYSSNQYSQPNIEDAQLEEARRNEKVTYIRNPIKKLLDLDNIVKNCLPVLHLSSEQFECEEKEKESENVKRNNHSTLLHCVNLVIDFSMEFSLTQSLAYLAEICENTLAAGAAAAAYHIYLFLLEQAELDSALRADAALGIARLIEVQRIDLDINSFSVKEYQEQQENTKEKRISTARSLQFFASIALALQPESQEAKNYYHHADIWGLGEEIKGKDHYEKDYQAPLIEKDLAESSLKIAKNIREEVEKITELVPLIAFPEAQKYINALRENNDLTCLQFSTYADTVMLQEPQKEEIPASYLALIQTDINISDLKKLYRLYKELKYQHHVQFEQAKQLLMQAAWVLCKLKADHPLAAIGFNPTQIYCLEQTYADAEKKDNWYSLFPNFSIERLEHAYLLQAIFKEMQAAHFEDQEAIKKDLRLFNNICTEALKEQIAALNIHNETFIQTLFKQVELDRQEQVIKQWVPKNQLPEFMQRYREYLFAHSHCILDMQKKLMGQEKAHSIKKKFSKYYIKQLEEYIAANDFKVGWLSYLLQLIFRSNKKPPTHIAQIKLECEKYKTQKHAINRYKAIRKAGQQKSSWYSFFARRNETQNFYDLFLNDGQEKRESRVSKKNRSSGGLSNAKS